MGRARGRAPAPALWVDLNGQKYCAIREKVVDARRGTAGILGVFQGFATQQALLFRRMERCWGPFRCTLSSAHAVQPPENDDTTVGFRLCTGGQADHLVLRRYADVPALHRDLIHIVQQFAHIAVRLVRRIVHHTVKGIRLQTGKYLDGN